MLLALLLCLLGVSKNASSYSDQTQESQATIVSPAATYEPRLLVAMAVNDPMLDPTPTPILKPQMVRIDPSKTYTRKTGIVAYKGTRLNCDRYPNAVGCCVEVMKNAGLLPQGKVTGNGTAGTIATEPLKLAEGERTVIVTREGSVGHTLEVEMKEGEYVVTKEGGFGRSRLGESVDPTVIKGKARLATIKKAINTPEKEDTPAPIQKKGNESPEPDVLE